MDHADLATRELKQAIGDSSKRGDEHQTRAGSFYGGGAFSEKSLYRGKVTASIFSPMVTQWILNMFAPPPPANIYDPFGGGGTRAMLSAASGFRYLGVEIRQEEVDEVRRRIAQAGLEHADVFLGDSRDQQLPDNWGQFLITCPPYFNMERYGGPAGDLSMSDTYEEFLGGLDVVVETSAKILRPGSLSCWVIGLHRDDDGTLLPMHHHLARIHKRHGFRHQEEVILSQVNNGALQRVGNFERGSHRLVRTHEYLEVFQT